MTLIGSKAAFADGRRQFQIGAMLLGQMLHPGVEAARAVASGTHYALPENSGDYGERKDESLITNVAIYLTIRHVDEKC